LFGKPEIQGRRRLGVVLTRDTNIDQAINKAITTAAKIDVKF
jgi:phosphoribosylglycinamide formyltransferase 2